MGVEATTSLPRPPARALKPDREISRAEAGGPVQCTTDLSHSPDEDLIEAVISFNNEALAILLGRHGKAVRNVGFRILRDEGEAADLQQELFLFLGRKAAIFDGTKSSVRSWIIQMAYQRAIERRRYLTARGFYQVEELDSERHAVQQSEDSEAKYARQLDGVALLQRYRNCLTNDQLRVLNFYFFEGLDFKEVAEMMGQTISNVRNHYYRALKRLRMELDSERGRE